MEDFSKNCSYKYYSKESFKINMRRVSFVLGILLFIEALFLIASAGISLIYQEEVFHFIWSFIITAAVGGILIVSGKNEFALITKNEGYCITGVSLLLFAVFGLQPYLIGGYTNSVTDAFFESLSGFTTTGLSVIENIDSLPHGILFWRSISQWIGGLAIIVAIIAFLPNVNGMKKHLFLADTTNITYHRISSGTGKISQIIISIYLVLTILATISLYWGGMSSFDAVCHAFSAVSTGGFSTRDTGIAYWNIPVIEITMACFMMISGINYALICLLIKHKPQFILKDDELKRYLTNIAVFTILIASILTATKTFDEGTSLLHAFFSVSSALSTNGIPTLNIGNWIPFLQMILVILLMTGACTGTAAGGFKNLRIIILEKNIKNQFRLMFKPNNVYSVDINRTALQPQLFISAFIFVILYLIFIFVAWVALLVLDVNFEDGIKAAIAAISNSGPGVMNFSDEFSWTTLPNTAKWILSFLMIAGKLEIIGLLLLFYRGFWRGNV